MNLGENIYHYRIQKNMSQGDLADALEVSRQSVSKWENNSAVPELEKLLKMTQIFGITLNELVTGEEQAPAPAPSVSTQTPVPVPPERLPARKITGTILLSAGLLLTIVCVILASLVSPYHADEMLAIIFLFGLPLAALGLCYLSSRRHPLVIFGWILYVYLTPISLLVTPITISGLFQLPVLAFGVILSVGTLVILWRGKRSRSAKNLLSLLIAAAALLPLLAWIPPYLAQLR